MKVVNTIAVSDFAAKTLNTREAARAILALVEEMPCKVNEIDFAGIEFMSRSFADEFHKEKIRLQEKFLIRIDILNAATEVVQILHRVANTQDVKERKKFEVPVYKFREPEFVYNYLLSI